VAGIAALLQQLYRREFNSDPDADLLKAAIELGAADLDVPGYDDFTGFGRVDAVAAAAELLALGLSIENVSVQSAGLMSQSLGTFNTFAANSSTAPLRGTSLLEALGITIEFIAECHDWVAFFAGRLTPGTDLFAQASTSNPMSSRQCAQALNSTAPALGPWMNSALKDLFLPSFVLRSTSSSVSIPLVSSSVLKPPWVARSPE
jgi:hypothetical protein